MNIKNIVRNIDNDMKHSSHFYVEKFKTFKYFRHLLLFIVAALLVAVISFGYQSYKIKKAGQAQTSLMSLIIKREKSSLIKDNSASDVVIQEIEKEYQDQRGTVYDPYFLLIEAEEYIQKGQKEKALEVMSIAILHLKSSPLFNLFLTKNALMLLDSMQSDKREQGLKDLISLAQDSTNKYRDYALYFLGLYYFLNNKKQDAKIVWQELIDMQQAEKTSQSPWIQLAQQKLDQMI